MLILTATQKCAVSIAPVDMFGNAAQVDGAPVWASSDEAIVTVVAAPDGLSVEVLTTGVVGSAQVSVTADADLGAGVTALTGLLDITVIAGAAVNLALAATAPVEK